MARCVSGIAAADVWNQFRSVCSNSISRPVVLNTRPEGHMWPSAACNDLFSNLFVCNIWFRLTWVLTVSYCLKKVVVSCVLPTQAPVIRRTYSNVGSRSFADAGPRLWMSLPAGRRQMDFGYEQFKQLLKTSLFRHRDRGTLWLFV